MNCPVCSVLWSPPDAQRCQVCDAERCSTCSFVNNMVINTVGVCQMCGSVLASRKGQQGPSPVVAAASGGGVNVSPRVPSHCQQQAPTATVPTHSTVLRRGSLLHWTTMERGEMEKRLMEARELCRAGGTAFVDVPSSGGGRRSGGGNGAYQWEQAPLAVSSPHQGGDLKAYRLVPRSAGGPQLRDDITTILRSVAEFFDGRGAKQKKSTGEAGARPPPGWLLFDPEFEVHPSEILQGQLGDCWFLSAVAVLAFKHPELIRSLFVSDEVNAEGVFGVRLWVDGAWTLVLVGPTFPTTNSGRDFLFARNRGGTALWVPLLEKAFSKVFGGYENIVGGRPVDALSYLTGMPCSMLRLPSHEHFGRSDHGGGGGGRRRGGGRTQPQSDEGAPETEDSLFAKLASMIDVDCTMCASCGGSPPCDVAAVQLGLEINHSYSLLSVAIHPISRERIVALRNPWGKSKFPGIADPQGVLPSPVVLEGRGGAMRPFHHTSAEYANDGAFWMRFCDFLKCFSEVDICHTKDYKSSYSCQQIHLPQNGDHSQRFGALTPSETFVFGQLSFDVEEETRACEVQLMAVQPDVKRSRAENGGKKGPTSYTDLCVVLMRLVPSGWELHSYSKSQCERLVCHTSMLEKGTYIAFPLSVSGIPPETTVTLAALSESSRLAFPSHRLQRLEPKPALSTARLLIAMVDQCDARKTQRLGGGDICVNSAAIGSLNVVTVRHAAENPAIRGPPTSVTAEVTVDVSKSEGLAIATSAPLAGISRCALPRGTAAVGAVASPFPNAGSYQTMFRYETKAMIRTEVMPIFGHAMVQRGASWIQSVFSDSASARVTNEGTFDTIHE